MCEAGQTVLTVYQDEDFLWVDVPMSDALIPGMFVYRVRIRKRSDKPAGLNISLGEYTEEGDYRPVRVLGEKRLEQFVVTGWFDTGAVLLACATLLEEVYREAPFTMEPVYMTPPVPN